MQMQIATLQLQQCVRFSRLIEKRIITSLKMGCSYPGILLPTSETMLPLLDKKEWMLSELAKNKGMLYYYYK
jgi:hypothetical protein